jgi:hypothetical protein
MAALPVTPTPAVLTWNRLEPRPRTREFDRTIRAEVRDALWMLTRQWQFGEFKGEDTGTAVFSKIQIETTKLKKLSQRGNASQALDESIPLETEVEKEAVPFDLGTRLEAGRHWLRLLKKRLPAATATTIISDMLIATAPISLQFQLPAQGADNAALYSSPEAWQVSAAVANGRTIDGGALYMWLVDNPTLNASEFIPGSDGDLNDAGVEFVAWFTRVYCQPSGAADSAWHENHLEYQFACSLPESDGTTTVLSAEEYYQGHVDWHTFDVQETLPASSSSDMKVTAAEGDIVTKDFTVIPSPVQFAGMPAPRWWEMEDYNIDLGDIDAATTDTAKILLAEFGLIYSNDWTLMPYNVPVGSLSTVKSIVVKDVFGQRTIVEHSGKGNASNWERWNMYTMYSRETGQSHADTRLFIPPVLDDLMESKPVEQVSFIRDEMANMVWGIETIIPDDFAGGKEGYEAAVKYRQYLESLNPTPPAVVAPVPNDAKIHYQIATTVPENWIPFIPVKLGTAVTSREIQLQRAAMPRVIPEQDTTRVRPRTELLRYGLDNGTGMWSPYYVFEEEVPKSGAVVNRTWQRTRWSDGSVVTWLGRRKTNGRGEQTSGLAFDKIEAKES